MADYNLPVLYDNGVTTFIGYRFVRTYGRRPAPRMDPNQKIAKKKLNNPVLWAQLDAVSRGTFVNHLGRGHTRRVDDHPYFN